MTMGMHVRLAMRAAMLGGVAMALSGCLGSPTYGTGTDATTQLLNDIGDVASIRPQQGGDIAYQPRPDLVRPTDTSALPAPQTALSRTQAWPESPEETRARLRAEADLSGGTGSFSSPLAQREAGGGRGREAPNPRRGPVGGPIGLPSGLSGAEAQADYRARQEIARAADPTTRNFLSEPPLEYRQPVATAPVGDMGESERTKERRRLQEAQRGQSLRQKWLPF
jgi:hypothetical protein